ncbi:MAG: hypothetical protein ACFFCF_00385 [Promethearchaeota archaeon]
MLYIIYVQPYLALPLIIVNLAVIYWVKKQSERSRGASCNDIVLAVVFACIALSLGMTSSFYSILEPVLIIFAVDAFLIMLWVVWKLVYKTGKQYR